jgi:HKD family nuclease
MKIDFIGHGLGADQNKTVANYLRNSFGDPNYDFFQGFIAYASLSGINFFVEKIEQRKERFKDLTFYIGIDDNGTSQQALGRLLSLNINTYIYHNPIKTPRAIFHPKVYVFKGEKANRIIIGSSNMTKPGLMTNVESSTIMEFIVNDSSGQKVLNQINEHFDSLIQKTHKNLAKLTEENLNIWIAQGLLYDEEKLFAGEDYLELENQVINKDDNLFTPELTEVISIDELEDIESETDIRIRNRRIVITERYLATWHIGFEKFKKYFEVNNTPLVPRDYDDRNFYHWYVKQKVLYKINLIPTEHFELLDEANFYFDDSNKLRHRMTWNLNFEKLKVFHNDTGLTYVEDSIDNTPELTFLARWCTRQRLYKRGIRRTLEQYQIELLEKLGFPWEVSSITTQKDDIKWLENLTKYAEFKKTYRRDPAKISEDKEESFLGTWCNSQRTSYKRKLPSMTIDRITLLEGEGFIWDKDEHNFELTVERLMYYYNDVGNFDVPLGYKADKTLAIY